MRLVVKISGNLIWSTNTLDTLLSTLLDMQKSGVQIALVPGGSIFADTVRSLQKKLNLDDSAAHWMAIKSMEVYGAFIASRSSYIDCVDSVEKVFTVWSRGRLPLIMPFNIIRENDLLPHTWYVTSDAISVFIASLLEADMVVLTKLVDGITINGTVAAIVRAHEVPLDQDVIDSYTPVLIRRYGIPTAIVNAGNTKTVSCLLEKIEGCPSYTLIIP